MKKPTLYCKSDFPTSKIVSLLIKSGKITWDKRALDIVDDVPTEYDFYMQAKYWVTPLGHFTLFLPESITGIGKNKKLTNCFRELVSLLEPVKKAMITGTRELYKDDPVTHGIRPRSYLSLICPVSRTSTLNLIFSLFQSADDLKLQLQAAEDFLADKKIRKRIFQKDIRRFHKVDEVTTHFEWNIEKKEWSPLNLLFMAGREKMLRFMGMDPRFSKPMMIVNSSNINREMTHSSNWTISGKQRRYILNRPNDIGLYMSIANKASVRARQVFDELHAKRITELIIDEKTVSKFYDFFEEIVQAIVMSYTTIECTANLCIPNNYTHAFSKEGITTIHDKQAIERYMALREKLKVIIPAVLKCGSPVGEAWWSDFIQLEEIRNEIIHTKKSFEETRYSAYINEKIFRIASVHNQIVSYYARLLVQAQSFSINDFPVGVGSDEVMPYLMTDKEFKRSFEGLFNPR